MKNFFAKLKSISMKQIKNKVKNIDYKKLGKQIFTFLFVKQEKQHSEKYYKVINFLNKYSLVFHFLLGCLIVFSVELLSRRSFVSAGSFIAAHTLAFFYNAFLVFASLMLVYFFRRRTFCRIIISGFWLILGVINGCVLSNRVTPFGYTDLKCIPDLLAMNKTNYFTAEEATMMMTGIGIFVLFCVVLFIKGPRYSGKINKILVPVSVFSVLFVGIPATTALAQSNHIVASYFSNIAQGYSDYGFVYSFSSSVVDRGMSKPDDYSKDTIEGYMANVESASPETNVTAEDAPNIVCILLESFVDPEEIKFLEYGEDPIPTFHYLEENFTTGYCTVPVVGAGTANSEFEVLTGMSMQYFGTGEYPYKTVLKKTDCESIASDLTGLGYASHVVHNNGGNFYSRANAFAMMGFKDFISKELMDITEWTPNEAWATDDILVSETIKTLDSTPGQPDFTYTITVGTHGDYPTEQIISVPFTQVTGAETEAENNAWTYYINQLHETDNFIKNLLSELEQRDEKTIVVMFGDHLPTMGLEEEDMVSGDIYKTNYVTWNNFGLPKEDCDLTTYQLLASTLDSVGIHEGTIFNYHQTQADSATYLSGLENLQYDILYGERYAFGDETPVFQSDLVMGIDEVVITDVTTSFDGKTVRLHGDNFTKWSKVYVNGEKVSTEYINGFFGLDCSLEISASSVKDGDIITVNQCSGKTIFRSSNDWTYVAPIVETEVETETEIKSEVE